MPSHEVVTLVPGTPGYVEVLDFLRSAANGGDAESEKMLRALAKGRCSLRSERLIESGQWTCPAGLRTSFRW